jgi:hypothetical protein
MEYSHNRDKGREEHIVNNPSVPTPPPAAKPGGRKPNLVLGLIAGTVAMLMCAAVLGSIRQFQQFPVIWLSIPLALVVGIASRWIGRGGSLGLGLAAAGLTLIGVVLEHVIAYALFLAQREMLNLAHFLTLFKGYFELWHLLIGAIAVCLAFMIAFPRSRKAVSQPA